MKKILFFFIFLSTLFNIHAQKITDAAVKFDFDSHKGVLSVIYDFPKGFHQNHNEEYFTAVLKKMEGITWDKIQYPQGKVENGIRNYYGKTELKIPFYVDRSIKKKKFDIEITAKYQLCNEKNICFLPKEEQISASFEVNENAGYFLTLLKYFLFALAGGLILNLMPCVFPVLSIKALTLVKQAGEKKEDILAGSLVYTAGVLVSFLALALIVIFIKRSGELVGWGFQFQNPVFIMVLTSIVFVFALSLFDIFIITFPGLNFISGSANKEGLVGSFFKGLLAVILATPCTAPLLGTALGFAFAQPYYLIIIIFLLVGLGLALPFLLLGIFPVLVKILPKPGEWLSIFREIMGLLLLGTAVWLLTVLNNMIGNRITDFLIFLAVLGLAFWFYGRFAKPANNFILRWIVIVISLAAIIAGAYFLLINKKPVEQAQTIYENSITHSPSQGWEKFTETRLNGYIALGKPVFIDFYADWCLTCKVNESMVLFTKEMQGDFKKYGVKLLYADYTKNDPLVAKWLSKYERAGVPLYVLYAPSLKKPYVFPEILTRSMITDVLKKNVK